MHGQVISDRSAHRIVIKPEIVRAQRILLENYESREGALGEEIYTMLPYEFMAFGNVEDGI